MKKTIDQRVQSSKILNLIGKCLDRVIEYYREIIILLIVGLPILRALHLELIREIVKWILGIMLVFVIVWLMDVFSGEKKKL